MLASFPRESILEIYLPQSIHSHHSFLKADSGPLEASQSDGRERKRPGTRWMGWERMRSLSADGIPASGPVEANPSRPRATTGLDGESRKPSGLILGLILIAWLFAGAGTSHAYSAGAWTSHAYSLAELIDDQISFSSLKEHMIFSDFQLLSTSIDESILDRYEVIPNRFGFWIFSPDFEPADPAEIAFSYRAEAAPGLRFNTVGLSMARLENAPINAIGDMWVESITGAMLAELDVSIQNGSPLGCGSGCGRRYDSDWATITPTQVLQISTFIDTGTPPVDWKTSQKFITEPIPEPSTALLLGLGIAGLALRRRNRGH